jgi:hypothetical protein
MEPSADVSTILNRFLDTAADNLRVAKILIQLGLDPNNITFDALFNRLIEIVLANITLANMFGLVGAILNAVRLRQMLKLVKKARNATQGDMSMEWLKPFMTERRYRQGDILFKKGDAATEMFLTVTGKFLVKEIGVELPPGRIMGEFGFVTPNNRRTGAVECIEDGQVLTITYERLLEIYFQNPQFGYYFLVLTSQRLLENIARLEGIITQQSTAPQTAAAGDVV